MSDYYIRKVTATALTAGLTGLMVALSLSPRTTELGTSGLTICPLRLRPLHPFLLSRTLHPPLFRSCRRAYLHAVGAQSLHCLRCLHVDCLLAVRRYILSVL